MALAVVFLANGMAAGGFFARLPEQQRRFDLSNAGLGLTVLGLATGALLASPVAGRAVTRRGSRPVVVASAVLVGATWWLAGVAPGAAALFGALAVIGAADAAMDISMNANAAAHEATAGRSVLHRLHALWSLGMVAGAAIGAVAAGSDVPLGVHFAAVGALVAVAVLAVARRLPDGAAPATGPRPAPEPLAAGASPRRRRVVLPAASVLAGLAAGGAVLEGAATDWSALQLERLGTSEGTAALGLAAFMAGMVGGRLVGDALTDRYGAAAVLRSGMVLVAAGMAAGLGVGRPVAFLAGLTVAGAGASVLFPLAFSASARTPGVTPGAGAAAVSLGGRIGFIAEPVVIGLVADATTLRTALWLVVAVAAALAVAAPQVVPRLVPSHEVAAPT